MTGFKTSLKSLKPVKEKQAWVLFLVGPTASGKSTLALRIAESLDGEIVSCDSMQVYRGMDIGTAKPSLRERKRIPHHLVDCLPPNRNFSVYDYRKRALRAIGEIISRGKLPIITGGSGLYVRSLLQGISPKPGADEAYRSRLSLQAERHGPRYLYDMLREKDRGRADRIKPNDKRRIIRALEIIEQSGKKASDYMGKQQPLTKLGYRVSVLAIRRERQALYRQIEKRVDQMFRRGLCREVELLAKKSLSRTASQAVGYKEILGVLKGRGTLQEARHNIKRNTRHLAKRQFTWFKRESDICWLDWHEGESEKAVLGKVLMALREAGLLVDGEPLRPDKKFKQDLVV